MMVENIVVDAGSDGAGFCCHQAKHLDCNLIITKSSMCCCSEPQIADDAVVDMSQVLRLEMK